MKKKTSRKPQARYDSEEKGFLCLICEETGLRKWLYAPWEMPRHLEESHKIKRKQQVIYDWNEEFEKEYLRNIKKPLKYEDYSITVDATPPEKYEEERKRRLMEAKARREA
jgi:hypothetical protein